MEAALAIIGGAGSAVFALWALITTVRNGGLRVANVKLSNSNIGLSSALKTQNDEYTDYKRRTKEKISSLIDEIESLEDTRHAEIEKIEDPKRRRSRRRAFVAELLSEASSADSASNEELPRDSSSNEGGAPEDLTGNAG